MSLIALLSSDGTVPCANCNTQLSVRLLAKFHKVQRLRAEGFAYIDFGDAILVNYCPHCEEPVDKEVPSWAETLLN